MLQLVVVGGEDPAEPRILQLLDRVEGGAGRRVASAGGDATVRLWSAASGAALGVLEGHRGTVWNVAFAPDGRRLASTGADGTVRLWRPDTGQLVRSWRAQQDWATGVAFSPDGRWLATAGKDARINLWPAAGGDRVRTLDSHGRWVNTIRFTPDGRLLVSGSDDRTFAVHEVASGRLLLSVRCPTEVAGVAVAPDGKTVAVTHGDQIRLYPLDLAVVTAKPRRLLREAQGAAGMILEGFRLRAASR